MNITFDIETTGLIPKGLNWKTDYMGFPHIVQIAWKRSDEHHIHNYIIKPEGYIIPDESIKIHGITNEEANKTGIDFGIVMLIFIRDCLIAEKIIGHNIYFDTSIIKANIKRYNTGIDAAIIALHKDKRIDTMMKTIKFCGLKQKDGKKPKFPSLEELYFKLFNETFDAHNAVNDVRATEKCYNKLIELNI